MRIYSFISYLLIATFIALMPAFGTEHKVEKTFKGEIVIGEALQLTPARETPGGAIKFAIHEGNKMRVTSEKGDWYLIVYKPILGATKSGWVKKEKIHIYHRVKKDNFHKSIIDEHIERSKPKKNTPLAGEVVDVANVYEYPRGQIIGRIPANKHVLIHSQRDNWYQVIYTPDSDPRSSGETGWVKKEKVVVLFRHK